MKYLLDTNAVIVLVNRRSAALQCRVREQAPSDIGLSVVVYHELFYGAFESQRLEANLEVVDRLEFEAVEFTKEDAREAGEVRAVLAKAGSPVGPYDVLIAAQARRRGLILITANTEEFARIEGLRHENWLAD